MKTIALTLVLLACSGCGFLDWRHDRYKPELAAITERHLAGPKVAQVANVEFNPYSVEWDFVVHGSNRIFHALLCQRSGQLVVNVRADR